MKDFLVYTTNGVKCLPLKLEYDETNSNHDVIHGDKLDLKLCGAPIIDQSLDQSRKYFVGVLTKDPDHANKFIPCFLSKEVLGE